VIRLIKRLLGRRRGYAALSLAIIGLMFTSALAVQFLVYVQNSLLAVRKAGQGLDGLYCGTAGVEYSLWRLRYESGYATSLEPNVPDAFDVPCDDTLVPVTLTLRTIPQDLPDYLSEYAFADIVLIMDVSASISSSEMDAFKQAANAIVDAFNLPENGERYWMGLTTFGRFNQPVINMTNQSAAMHQGINSLSSTSIFTCFSNPNHIACGTNIVAGINGSAAQFLTGFTKYFDSAGTYTFTFPPGVTSINVEAWGGGGPTGTARGSGGGGGAYSRSTFSVTPGAEYTINVGAGGATGQAGGDSWFGAPATLLAKGGASPGPTDGGAQGGQASLGVGSTKYSGGNGGNRGSSSNNTGGGGGGGGSAFPTANGGNGGNGGGSPEKRRGWGAAGAAIV
jgi:hypothetical protein